jgi:hypothetical protein
LDDVGVALVVLLIDLVGFDVDFGFSLVVLLLVALGLVGFDVSFVGVLVVLFRLLVLLVSMDSLSLANSILSSSFTYWIVSL